MDTDAMFAAYVECAEWADAPRDENGDEEDSSGWAQSALDEMRADVDAFAEAEADDLAGMDAGQAGHDFWLTRNGHGAGFWDRGLGERGDRLTKAAHVYGESSPYVGDDGLMYV